MPMKVNVSVTLASRAPAGTVPLVLRNNSPGPPSLSLLVTGARVTLSKLDEELLKNSTDMSHWELTPYPPKNASALNIMKPASMDTYEVDKSTVW